MSEIERLANAGRAGWLDAIDRSETAEQLWDATARAFLTAMREPASGLLDAATTALGDPRDFGDCEARVVWQAMIDHILNETE